MLATREPVVFDRTTADEWSPLLGDGALGPGIVQPLVHRDQLLGYISVARQPGDPAFTRVTEFYVRARLVADAYHEVHPVVSGRLHGLRIEAAPIQ